MDVKQFGKELRNGHFEKTDDGRILLPRSKVLFGGVFTHSVRRNGVLLDEQQDHNIVVDEMCNHALNIIFRSDEVGNTPITAWYLGIFEGNYTPVAGDTAANIAANATESVAYAEATRQAWVEGAVASKTIDNLSNKATFTINATKTIFGAFLVSESAKQGTTGVLAAATKFASQRDVISGDELLVSYQMTAADA